MLGRKRYTRIELSSRRAGVLSLLRWQWRLIGSHGTSPRPRSLPFFTNTARETNGAYTLDGVITVIDVENWTGYDDTSYTAKIQARYTDLIVFNKWELAGERRMDECLDRMGDLEVPVAWVKSDRGRVPVDIVFGVDGGLARTLGEEPQPVSNGYTNGHEHVNGHSHSHSHSHDEQPHQSEVEVLSITLSASPNSVLDPAKLLKLLKSAPKDEVYRIKAVLASSSPIPSSDDTISEVSEGGRYILNWAFGRWTCTPLGNGGEGDGSRDVVRMTMILARGESRKWIKRIEIQGFVEVFGGQEGKLRVERIA
jgi:G3E family GTPase